MASAEAATQQMETMLKDELDLTEDQQARISFCLRDREIELHECHASIRRSGVFVPLDDGKTLLGMKEGWYRRIDSVLDSRQHERFSVLVDQGLLRPGTDVGVNLDEVIVVR